MYFFDVGCLRQEKTHEIVSSVIHVPMEGVEDGHKHFKDARDVLVERLLVFALIEGLAYCHEGSHDVGDNSHFVRCLFPMGCV